jgi:hypothetical protein
LALLLVDDLVGGDPAVLEVEPHLMLGRLAAREHDHLRGKPNLPLEQASDDHLAEGSGPSGHHDSLTGEQALS